MREKKERKKKAKSQISTPFDHFRFQISNFGITSPQPHSHPFFIRVHPSVSMLQATWLTVYTPAMRAGAIQWLFRLLKLT